MGPGAFKRNGSELHIETIGFYGTHRGRSSFLTLDTFEGRRNDPLSLHKYAYCQDNPVNNTDPSGNDIGDLLTVMDISGSFMAMGGATTLRAGVAAGVGGTCGPEVTAAEMTLDVERAFMPPNRGFQVAINAASRVWTPTMAKHGWDIGPVNELAHLGRPDFGNGSRLGIGTGRDTVQFSFMGQPAKVYYAGSVNYILERGS